MNCILHTYFSLTIFFKSENILKSERFKYIYIRVSENPLPLWEGMNETLNQPKADEISQVL